MLAGLALDLWTKDLAFKRLAAGPPFQYLDTSTDKLRWAVRPNPYLYDTRGYVVIPHLVHFSVTVNEGAVFGMGQGRKVVFISISILAILFLTYLFAASGNQRFYQVILGLLLAGILGNMYDRVEFGYVRDMIYGLPGWHWPGTDREVFPWIFNVADVLLCVGVGLIFIHGFFNRHKAPELSPPPTPASPEKLASR
jgi:signal peptidase II